MNYHNESAKLCQNSAKLCPTLPNLSLAELGRVWQSFGRVWQGIQGIPNPLDTGSWPGTRIKGIQFGSLRAPKKLIKGIAKIESP